MIRKTLRLLACIVPFLLLASGLLGAIITPAIRMGIELVSWIFNLAD